MVPSSTVLWPNADLGEVDHDLVSRFEGPAASGGRPFAWSKNALPGRA
jgi:hypothetical protein